ncbi:uncharacterized protein CANTADRAFT_22146 [Suhomyces tanzawaensis NRRL Y-17324]|uniref:Uncharacterized protein n=1 Tax=Suhomyces tanzawaensis NRRL Y-17324 TaxID=984487 RepID=A0A1E4SIR6_9ASCO|nr:uncharacterized protein CANTADRAFT_22146 [Suhomyces tanzawaensis NRRL Y-17324]ODV79403.1 hypothetical protein CANTADRAFT_22146 [Suhomyces tanzawaensis NRRL Y-17324]
MSFNSDIDKTMDNLTLVDRSEPSSEPSQRGHPVLPKKSLLSSSLASERAAYGYAQNRNYHPPSKAHFSLDGGDRPSPANIDIQKHYTDDHPEPELLASSVGKDINGRLIPSSSTISLLSLNNLQNDLDSTLIGSTKDSQTLSKLQQHFQLFQTQPVINQPQAFVDRKNSYSAIPSRNSITHLNQIRLQPYQRFTSPPPAGPHMQQISPQTSQESHHSTSQSIPINSTYKGNIIVPDSPNLDPTSLGGSPSRFWLSSQTPPRSMSNSLTRNSRSYLYQTQNNQNPNQTVLQPQIQTQTPSTQGQDHANIKKSMYISLQPNAENFNYTTTIVPLDSAGHDSPNLVPVQTPLEDPPMTPLYLNKLTLDSGDSYFGNYTFTGTNNEFGGKDITSVATLIEENEIEEDDSSEELKEKEIV